MTPEQYSAHLHHAAQQPKQPSLGDVVAQHIAHRVGLRITNGLENVFWGACDTVASGYHWMRPTTAEHVRKMAIFTRRELDAFIAKASKEGRSYVIVQTHRITLPLRAQFTRDGYVVTTVNLDGADAIKIAWGGEPTLRPIPQRCDVAPKAPASS